MGIMKSLPLVTSPYYSSVLKIQEECLTLLPAYSYIPSATIDSLPNKSFSHIRVCVCVCSIRNRIIIFEQATKLLHS